MDEIIPRKRAIQAMKDRKPGPVDSHSMPGEAAPASQSFEDSFLEHWNPIYRLLVRITGDPAEAEDLALETFLRLYRQPPRSGEGYNPGGWLYRVATNLGLLPVGAGVDSAWKQEKPGAREMLVNGDESHLSSARFVRQPSCEKTRCSS